VAGHPAGSVESKAAVGFLPQRIDLPENVEVVEVLRFFAGLRVPGRAGEAVREAIDAVGLSGLERRPVQELSGGMLQRVALAQVVLGNPPVLLLDEPALNLDIEGRQRLRGILDGVRRRGGCALVSSHLLDEALQSADRVVILQGGRILADESVAAIAARLESRLHVEIEDAPAARGYLAGLGYRVSSNSAGGLVVSCSPDLAVRVLGELHNAGFCPRDFRTTRMTLEELVLSYLQAPPGGRPGRAGGGGG
ncbi:MAG: ABC transporter ATP-binding protein, partial [Bacillota bacterium]